MYAEFMLEFPARLLQSSFNSVSLVETGTAEAFMALTNEDRYSDAPPNLEHLVSAYYRALYLFALSLTQTEADACDLTQQTFYIWARKGHQLRDASKVKTWLFTTLHREFLKTRRRRVRFPEQELEAAELPAIDPAMMNQIDAQDVLAALGRLNELYRAPVTLFYLDELSYKEIADVLAVPLGTVQSRIARGKAQLQRLLLSKDTGE
jgi:RNA polymerase sigma-70 factor (ECF subfamily)